MQRVRKADGVTRYADRQPNAALPSFHAFEKTQFADAGANTYDADLRLKKAGYAPAGLWIDLYI